MNNKVIAANGVAIKEFLKEHIPRAICISQLYCSDLFADYNLLTYWPARMFLSSI
jgi:hypothetical protein